MNIQEVDPKILDKLLLKLIENLEKGRDNIYLLAEAINHKIQGLQLEIKDLNLTLAQLDQVFGGNIPDGKAGNKREDSNTKRQPELIKLQQIRDDLLWQLESLRVTYRNAYEYMDTTHMALRVLQGQLTKFDQPQADVPPGLERALWLLESQEVERRKISRELHDGPAQTLAAVLMELDYLQRLGDQDPDSLRPKLDLVKKMSRDCLDEIRRIIFDLKPALLDPDLHHTLQEYLRDIQLKYNLEIEFSLIGDKKKYGLVLAGSIFRIVQEAISNIHKHAGTQKAMVRLEDNGQRLTLIIKDQGIGFDLQQQTPEESYGLLGIKERVQLLGGVMEIHSQPGAGTQIIIIVPLEGEESNESQG